MLNMALLVGEAILYFVIMSALLRARHRFGIGLFFCALGTMHFLETYLASVFYVTAPGGLVLSPGSTVLFAGKLLMLLLVYIREDAAVVRQPIYGLLIGNLLSIGFVAVLRLHGIAELAPGRDADMAFIDEMGVLMILGTVLLFVDGILIILVYERLGRWLGGRRFLRVWASASLILTLDHLGFYAGLHLVTGAPASVLLGGWAGKMAAAFVYSVLVGFYLRWIATNAYRPDGQRLRDVFDVLTYRERYESLLKRTGRDGLTGVLDRGRFDIDGPRVVAEVLAHGRPPALMMIDIDHFKSVNDTWGHVRGDAVLRVVGEALRDTVRASDIVYRYGGEEFVVLAADLAPAFAWVLAERIRMAVHDRTERELGLAVTVSIGLAVGPTDGTDLRNLFAEADRRLYRAKAEGRNRTVAEAGPAGQAAPGRVLAG